MASIEVRPSGENDSSFSYQVTVRDQDGSESLHSVTLSREDWLRLGVGFDTPVSFVRACFEFLLGREAKESILGSFDVSVIGRYFPEFEGEITRGRG
jgi:hypothetical protein